MKKVTHCTSHTRYTPGCAACLKQSRAYREDKQKRNDTTHHKNGQVKNQGLYSQDNWDRFNSIGKRLTKPNEGTQLSKIDPIETRWRTGRKNHRIIYMQPKEIPTDLDPMIGVMDDIQVAREVVATHNARLFGSSS